MKKGKVILILVLIVCSLLLLVACGTTATEETGTADYHYDLQPASWQEVGFWADQITYWSEYVTEHTEGRVTASPSLPGAIVPVDQQMDAVSTGTTGAMAVPSAYYASTIPIGYVFCTPPVVQGVEDLRDFYENYQDGRAGQLWEQAVEAKYNVKVIGEMYGLACVPICSSKSIPNIDALKGLKIRVGAGAIADTLGSFGASCVFAPSSEAYSMLSAGTIDGVVTGSPSDMLGASFNEVTQYWVKDPYLNTTHCTTLVINKDIWDALTAEDQQVLIDALAYSNEKVTAESKAAIDTAWETAEADGLTIQSWPQEDQVAWATAFYNSNANYKGADADYTEFMTLLHSWAVEKGYMTE